MKQRLPMLAVGLAFVLCAVTAEAQVAFQLFADNPDGLCDGGASASWQNGVGEGGGQGLVLTKALPDRHERRRRRVSAISADRRILRGFD